MPSRCMFFLTSRKAWSTVVSQPITCTGGLELQSEGVKGADRIAQSAPIGKRPAALRRVYGAPARRHIAAMASLPILRAGHPVLRQIAQPIGDPTEPELQRLVEA